MERYLICVRGTHLFLCVDEDFACVVEEEGSVVSKPRDVGTEEEKPCEVD